MPLIMQDNTCLVYHNDCRRGLAIGKPPSVCCMTIFFFEKLLIAKSDASTSRQVARWLSNDIFLKTDLFLFPLRDEARKHWVLVAIDMHGQMCEFYDSAQLPHDKNSFAHSAFDLVTRYLDAKALSCGSQIRPSSFKRVGVVDMLPQQSDGDQCGVFVLAFASLLARGHKPPFYMMDCVTIEQIRDRIAYEILLLFKR